MTCIQTSIDDADVQESPTQSMVTAVRCRKNAFCGRITTVLDLVGKRNCILRPRQTARQTHQRSALLPHPIPCSTHEGQPLGFQLRSLDHTFSLLHYRCVNEIHLTF